MGANPFDNIHDPHPCLLGQPGSFRKDSGNGAVVGRARPRTSERQFIEFAVNIPAQEPTPGHAQPSTSFKSFKVISRP
jgi:hypothetical protein